MRLQRLELSGFKSFPDRSELAFDRGVTAIVGPNGCGKSNLVDAITWVLGEQSARSLRGDRMEDVIFGGSDARKPTAAAEVRLKLTGVTSSVPARLFGPPSTSPPAADNGHDAIQTPGNGTGNGNGNGHGTAHGSWSPRSTSSRATSRRARSRRRRSPGSISTKSPRSCATSRWPAACTGRGRAST